MGVKCSLLGHKFTGTTVDEEREEDGSEVVTTVREIEICDRCGKQRVVSENKEVTAIERADETGDDEAAAADAVSPDPESAAGFEFDADGVSDDGPSPAPDMDAVEDDAELIGEAESAADADAGASAATESATAADVDAPGTSEADGPASAGPESGSTGDRAAGDDAVPDQDVGAEILDEADADRDPGEWPEDEGEDESAATETPAGTPSLDHESGETEREPVQDAEGDDPVEGDWPDEYGHESGSSSVPEVEWPTDDENDDEWEPSENLTQHIDGAEVERAGGGTVTVPEGEFACSECGFTTPVDESSLREGDFCPECRRGTLAHRPEA